MTRAYCEFLVHGEELQTSGSQKCETRFRPLVLSQSICDARSEPFSPHTRGRRITRGSPTCHRSDGKSTRTPTPVMRDRHSPTFVADVRYCDDPSVCSSTETLLKLLLLLDDQVFAYPRGSNPRISDPIGSSDG